MENARILVASDNISLARQVAKPLRYAYESVTTCANMNRLASEFQRCNPTVLLLAFRDIALAEQHYLGIYRLKGPTGSRSHCAILLCDEKSADSAFKKCQDGLYYDYAIIWPSPPDPYRLAFSIQRAVREIEETNARTEAESNISTKIGELDDLEFDFERSLAQGELYIEAVSNAVQESRENIESAMERFSKQLQENAGIDPEQTNSPIKQLSGLKEKEIARNFDNVASLVEPVREWRDRLSRSLDIQKGKVGAIRLASTQVRRTILVADDDPYQLKLLALLLTAGNFSLFFAESGAEALAACERESPDLILLDVNMPDMTGLDVTRRLKSHPSFTDTSIIMMTGLSARDIVEDSLRAGANDFIVKPITKHTLYEKISKVLYGRWRGA